MIDVRSLGSIEVFRPDGSRIELGSLWARQPVVLAMVRHFG